MYWGNPTLAQARIIKRQRIVFLGHTKSLNLDGQRGVMLSGDNELLIYWPDIHINMGQFSDLSFAVINSELPMPARPKAVASRFVISNRSEASVTLKLHDKSEVKKFMDFFEKNSVI